VRFVSYEPALGPVDFSAVIMPDGDHLNTLFNDGEDAGVDWVIAGGESGPGARPPHPNWFRSVRDQCRAAGVAFLFKQWGEWAPQSRINDFAPGQVKDGVRYSDGVDMVRVGKKAAGRLLDGREWNEFPEVLA
jgi:protein gp37